MDQMMNNLYGGMGQQMSQSSSRQLMASPFGGMSGGRILTPMVGFPSLIIPSGMGMGLNMGMNMQMPQGGGGGGGSFYSSSMVISNGHQVYESTHSNVVNSNGVREERKTVRDSRTGEQSMSIGRHIHERGHVIEKKKNNYTGDEEENNEYINIEEEEADQFQREWQSKSQASRGQGGMLQLQHNQQRRQQQHQRPMLAITAGGESSSSNNSSARASPSTSHHISSKDKNKLKIKTPTGVFLKEKKDRKDRKDGGGGSGHKMKKMSK